MKLLINGSILSSRNTGLGVYTHNLLDAAGPILTERGIDYDVLCRDAALLPEHCRSHALEMEFSGYLSRNWQMNKASVGDYDLIWSTTHHGAVRAANQIITIHDVTPLKYPRGRWQQFAYYKYVLPRILKRCRKVLTVSQNTKQDILAAYGGLICAEKVGVVYEGAPRVESGGAPFSKVAGEFGIQRSKYYCILGIHYDYKNIHQVVMAYAKHEGLRDAKVVVVGNDSCQYGNELKGLIAEKGLSSNFVFTGFVNDDVKVALLRNSIACIYPSLYEGFGLPLLEAMECDAPVLSSNASSLPEVGGGAALYFDPRDADDLAHQMKRISSDASLRKSLIDKGRMNLTRFDGDVIARRTLDAVLT